MYKFHSVRVAALVAALLVAPGLHALEVAGVQVEEKAKVGSQDLVLNGAGIRSKVFIKVYIGALYVPQKASSAAALVDGNGPRRMSLRLLRDVDADSLYNALRDGLKDNSSEAEQAAFKPQQDQFAAIMRKVGNAKNGDTVTLDFSGEGVAVSFNGESKGAVAGAPFAKALLKVWLGDNPVDGSLKKALLGS